MLAGWFSITFYDVYIDDILELFTCNIQPPFRAVIATLIYNAGHIITFSPAAANDTFPQPIPVNRLSQHAIFI